MDKIIPTLGENTEEINKESSTNNSDGEFIFWDDMWKESDENER
jgi:hypothetical protein